jgi:nucleoside-diphosphate-sugar epimerase
MNKRVLVTGASGLVGRHLVPRLVHDGYAVRAASRYEAPFPTAKGIEMVRISDLAPDADWRPALHGVQVVVHLAARNPRPGEPAPAQPDAYRRSNVEGTQTLFEQAAEAGVSRFVHVSSVKVHGDATVTTAPLVETDPMAPCDAYAFSKCEAEQRLQALAAACEVELVIVRPPMVYGPNARSHINTLARWIARGRPLPLAAITANRRSLVGIDNLTSFLATAVAHPAAAHETFFVADGQDVSTAELVARLGAALGRAPRNLPLPPQGLAMLARLLGKQSHWQRLVSSLAVDISKAKTRLGWSPPVTLDEGFRRLDPGFEQRTDTSTAWST